MSATVLRRSTDRKTDAYAGQKNTFGLLPGLPENGGTCPGATTEVGGCMAVRAGLTMPTCYVHAAMSVYKAVRGVLAANTHALTTATRSEMEIMLTQMVADFVKVETRRNKVSELRFRLHWSGDIFSRKYAQALKATMEKFPQVKFWGYTRNFSVLSVFAGMPNCALYLSLDPANFAVGMKHYELFKDSANIKLAFMGNELPTELADIKFVACPADAGKMPVTGACQTCKLCIKGSRHIQFNV